MTFTLDHAVVYDIETIINCFTLTAETLNGETVATWEISEYRDDRAQLFQWLDWLQSTQTPMISFKGIDFDYPVLHFIYMNRNCTVRDIYDKAQQCIAAGRGPDIGRFAHIIWERHRFAPQIDLFKIHHFDNKAKMTSLKALQVNMRSETVVDMPVEHFNAITRADIDRYLIPYNIHDVKRTKDFALMSMSAIDFRIGLIPQFGIEVLNYNDTKIGEKMLEQRLGSDVCYTTGEKGRKKPRQTVRSRIALNEIIFPYIQFTNPEFQRVLDYMRAQVLTPDDIDDPEAPIKTKGVFTGLSANIGGVSFEFGTGGIHASVNNQRFASGGGWVIRDIDVASLYPSIAIVNRLAPTHLGDAFVDEYAKLPAERKQWQKTKGKKCVEANSIKLAANGAYGKTNSKFSFLYDPQYTLTVTINGQLMLAMLAEWLMTVPTLSIIQVNTDGITYFINEQYIPDAKHIEQQWQDYTKLVLEDVHYNRMWIADVNTYIAEDMDGNLKQKGRLWHPESGSNYAKSISECQPPAWHKDLSNIVSIRAAVAAMVHGVDPATYIRAHTDPYDFACRVKVDRGAELWLGGRRLQPTTRYYVATDGEAMLKRMPAAGPLGAYKRATKVSEADYNRRMAETGGEWCATVCTKNKSRYEIRDTAIEAGWRIRECNDMRAFSWANVDYRWYETEAKKLIIA